jgi:hypothetical protein
MGDAKRTVFVEQGTNTVIGEDKREKRHQHLSDEIVYVLELRGI